MPCTWPADIFASVLKHLDCEAVIALCSTTQGCATKCAEVLTWPEFPRERRKAAFNCVIHNIFDILRKDARETCPPGCEWLALDEQAFHDFLVEHEDARDLDENDIAFISFN